MSSTRKKAQGDQDARRDISGFARRLLAEWNRLALPVAGERVMIAVSGGADSTALLLAFDELVKTKRLALKVVVAHLDHRLRGDQGARDAQWVAELARELGYEVELSRAAVKERAHDSRDNLEQAARRARYEFLSRVADQRKAKTVLTAHTMDDQAETALLNLMRGSGTDGLSGMRPMRLLDEKREIVLVRPLLRWARRAETVAYCQERGILFRVDEMNEDEKFSRVRVRRKLLPLLEDFNPRIVEALARTAELLREDAAALEALALKLLEEASEKATAHVSPLRVELLANAPVAVRRRALRQWIARGRGDLRRVEMVHIMGIEQLLVGERGGRVAELPGGSFVERRRGRLWFHDKKS